MRTRYLVPVVCWLSLAAFGLAACGPDDGGSQEQQCEADEDCRDDEACRAGVCMKTCESDDDCEDSCEVGGVCVTTCGGEGDDGGGDCGSGRSCDEEAGVCWPEGEELATCEEGDDTECSRTEYCAEDVCLPSECEDDSDCSGANICDEAQGRCRSGCRAEEECPGDEICDASNRCVVAGCAGPAVDCGQYEQCNTETDPTTCEFTGECGDEGDDDICQGYADQQDAEVPYICDPDQGECVKKPPCESYEDCDENELCEKRPDDRNRCIRGCLCTDPEECDRPCGPREVCTDERECKTGCQTDQECVGEDGDVCVNNACRDSCESASDCDLDGLVCRETDGERICQECTRSNQCPATEECRFDAEDSRNEDTGLCRPLPPECPTDGYNDNHRQQDAYEIKKADIPFEATEQGGQSKPTICRNPASNPKYMSGGGDWWKFEAGQAADPRVIDVTIAYDQENVGNIDLALVRSDGTQIASSIRPPGEEDGKERIVYGVRAADTFFVQVTQALKGGLTNAEYELTVDVRPPKSCGMDGKEENDSRSDAESLAPDTSGTYTVCGDDKDFYELDAKANQNVTVTAENVPERLGDVVLRLTDPQQGNKVVEKRQSTNGTIELKHSTQDASTLILEIASVGNAPGWVEYDLKWTQSANQCDDTYESNDICTESKNEAYQIQRKTSKQTFNNLSVCTDDDFYAIDLFPRDTIRVETEYDKTDGIKLLTLFGPNSCTTKKGSFTTKSLSGSKQKLIVEYKVPRAGGGTYYIKVEKDQGPGHIPHKMTVDVTQGQTCTDDDLESNNSQSAPTSLDRTNITKGGEDSFFLSKKICDADEDWYCLQAQNQDNLAWDVEFTHADGDLDAFIVGPSGNQKASSKTDTDDESVSYKAQSNGTHCLKIAGDGPARNDYDLFGTVDGQPSSSCPDIYEANDSCSDTTSCTASTPSVGTNNTDKLLACSGDEDWYETCVDAGQTLDVKTEFKHTEGDISLDIYDEDGLANKNEVPETDGNSSNNGETVSVSSSKDQCYYYNVSLDSGQRNDYDMTVEKTGPPPCPDDSDEGNDSDGTATQMDAPGLEVAQFKCENDEDWYEFDLNSGQKFEVFVNHNSDLGDIDIEVFEQGDLSNPAGTSSSSDDDESVVLSSPSSGTHYLRVDTKGNSRLPYDVLLYQDLDGSGTFENAEGPEDRACPDRFENNDSQSEAAGVGVDTYTDLLMCVPDPTTGPDDDWYEIYVPKDAEITADATFAHADGDIDMELYRLTQSGTTQVGSSTTDTDNESVNENYTSSGATYFIKVTGQTSSTFGFRNSYELSVSVNFTSSCPEDSIGTTGSGNFSKSDAASISSRDFDMGDSLTLCENTEDWFTFTPSSNGTARFGLSQTSALGEINIELQDSNGTIVGTVSESYNGDVKVAEYAGLSAGQDYYVRVYPNQNRVIRNDYDLWASWSGNTPSEPWCPDMYERNDVQSGGDSAQISFTDGRSQHPSALACGAEEDWYEVDLDSSSTYRLDAFFEHDSDSDLTIEMRDDTGSVVKDDNGTDIAFGTNDSSDNDEQTVFTPGSSGTYYFGVKNKLSGATTDPFQIVEDSRYTSGSTAASNCQSSYDDQNEENDNDTQAVSIGPSLPIGLEVQACDQDVYKWTAPSDGQVSATVYMDNANVNLGVEVENFSNNNVVVDDQGITNPTTDNRAGGTFSANSGDTYVIRITRGNLSGSVANGPYILRLE